VAVPSRRSAYATGANAASCAVGRLPSAHTAGAPTAVGAPVREWYCRIAWNLRSRMLTPVRPGTAAALSVCRLRWGHDDGVVVDGVDDGPRCNQADDLLATIGVDLPAPNREPLPQPPGPPARVMGAAMRVVLGPGIEKALFEGDRKQANEPTRHPATRNIPRLLRAAATVGPMPLADATRRNATQRIDGEHGRVYVPRQGTDDIQPSMAVTLRGRVSCTDSDRGSGSRPSRLPLVAVVQPAAQAAARPAVGGGRWAVAV
jgi:hypothetical protein